MHLYANSAGGGWMVSRLWKTSYILIARSTGNYNYSTNVCSLRMIIIFLHFMCVLKHRIIALRRTAAASCPHKTSTESCRDVGFYCISPNNRHKHKNMYTSDKTFSRVAMECQRNRSKCSHRLCVCVLLLLNARPT